MLFDQTPMCYNIGFIPKQGKRLKKCKYGKNVKDSTVYIVIACEDGLPVHYAKGAPHIPNELSSEVLYILSLWT